MGSLHKIKLIRTHLENPPPFALALKQTPKPSHSFTSNYHSVTQQNPTKQQHMNNINMTGLNKMTSLQ